MIGCVGVDVLDVSLMTHEIHGLGCASSDDQILLVDQALLDATLLVMTAGSILIRDIHRTINKIVPTMHLLGPYLERVKEMQRRAVGEHQFAFAEFDESFNRVSVVINIRIANEVVDAIHLERDLSANRYLAAHDLVSKYTVVMWGFRIR